VGASLTAEAALAFAAALGTATRGGRIVLGRDGRPSGLLLRHAVLAGLLGTGCEVHDLGVIPTPTCGLAVRRLEAAGAVQITASHNPAQWNGLKLFAADGRVMTAAAGQNLKSLFDTGAFSRSAWNQLGTVREGRQGEAWHREAVLSFLNPAALKTRRFRVLLDANGGAGGPLGQSLLEACHCQAVILGGQADGDFAHDPEPVEPNLRSVCPQVAQAGADIGFVLDPDADRLALIDETGRYIGEELTLALAVLCRLRQTPPRARGPVVINMSTSRLIEDLARLHDVPCHRAPVGEAHVVDKMIEVGAPIGGEGNGGVIDPRVGLVRDPFIGMGLILSLMADTGKTLSALVAELPSYTIIKDKYRVDQDRLPALFRELRQRWPETAVNDQDGLRLDWPQRWVHVRPSNTEPIVRVIAEAPQAAEAEGLCREVGKLLQE
jgi:phosphomannomutase